MNFSSIATMLIRGDFYYALGRFHLARQCYSFLKRYAVRPAKNTLISNKLNTLFPEITIEKSVNELKKDAVAFGFNLPMPYVLEIQNYAQQKILMRSGDRKEFSFSEVKNGRLADGNSVVLGFAKNPLDCSAVKRIATDEMLLAVCTRYLGYQPTSLEPRLFWSFVTNEPDHVRREKWQTTGYHFDVDGFNFIYINFYITPVTRNSGAHVMMKGSHNHKPLRMLFHSAYHTDEAVIKQFGSENEITIKGPAGFGFIQDSSCYHKALAPVANKRLMLQLRIK